MILKIIFWWSFKLVSFMLTINGSISSLVFASTLSSNFILSSVRFSNWRKGITAGYKGPFQFTISKSISWKSKTGNAYDIMKGPIHRNILYRKLQIKTLFRMVDNDSVVQALNKC